MTIWKMLGAVFGVGRGITPWLDKMLSTGCFKVADRTRLYVSRAPGNVFCHCCRWSFNSDIEFRSARVSDSPRREDTDCIVTSL